MDVVKQIFDREDYPSFPYIKTRRLHELNWLLPRLEGRGTSLIDIGCGDGALVNCLYHLTNLELQACDFAVKLMTGVNPNVPTFEYDCRKPGTLPETDIALSTGVFQYLFEDSEIDALLQQISAPLLFVRSTCGNDERIDTYSDALQTDYQSRYRSVEQMETLLREHYDDVKSERIFPDEIESKFGTKQWYFTAKR